jgi:DNA-3-methyladenine glycosylase
MYERQFSAAVAVRVLGENEIVHVIAMSPEVSSPNPTRLPGNLLPRAFFEHPPEQVAPLLLGKILVRRVKERELAGRIVEVEAYLGPHNDPPDPAAHAHRGITPRNAVLFGPAGHAYVYGIYGMHFCMNISCEVEGRAGSVLLRALEPLIDPLTGIEAMTHNRHLKAGVAPREITGGPSRLCQALAITRPADNGVDLLDPASSLQVRDDGFSLAEYIVTPRIGITHAADRPLRFVVPGNPCVSGPRSLTGRRVKIKGNRLK